MSSAMKDNKHPPLRAALGIWGYVYKHSNTHEDLLGRVLSVEVERKAHKIALISI